MQSDIGILERNLSGSVTNELLVYLFLISPHCGACTLKWNRAVFQGEKICFAYSCTWPACTYIRSLMKDLFGLDYLQRDKPKIWWYFVETRIETRIQRLTSKNATWAYCNCQRDKVWRGRGITTIHENKSVSVDVLQNNIVSMFAQ